jgi:hypothetical protein
VTRAWIFQANPERYNIDGALDARDTIAWRVPQYTGEIRPGHAVAVWRAGAQAGVVGVGRVKSMPSHTPGAEQGVDPFDRSGEGTEPATVVELSVAACPFVSKDEVAALPELGLHRIVTAPMGTVFPLEGHEWAALRRLVPEPPQIAVPSGAQWPPAFSWGQRTKSITLLPGGIEAYREVLAQILAEVADSEPSRDELAVSISQQFDVGRRRGVLVVGFLTRIALLAGGSSRLELTPEAERWRAEGDDVFLLALIHGRVRYLGEMLAHLEQPRALEEVLEHANSHYAMNWTSMAQIVRRRHLLGGLGAVAYDDHGRLARTQLGEQALAALSLAPPISEEAEDTTDVSEPSPLTHAAQEIHDDSPCIDPFAQAERLVERLTRTAHGSQDHEAFEQAVCDAFAFLGFDAQWYGGSGRPDVLLTAPLGVADQYRVVVDAKTTARDAVGDAHIDWVTIDEHQARYAANHAAVVAPDFRGERLTHRSRRDRSVALLTVAELTTILQQHASAPIDLDAYRSLFDPEQGVETAIEHGETLRRQLVLAAEALHQVEQLASDEGPVAPADLYWNLESFADQFEGQRASREEISAVCHALANPPLSVLRSQEQGYAPLGSSTTTANRLRLLAELVESGIPETR